MSAEACRAVEASFSHLRQQVERLRNNTEGARRSAVELTDSCRSARDVSSRQCGGLRDSLHETEQTIAPLPASIEQASDRLVEALDAGAEALGEGVETTRLAVFEQGSAVDGRLDVLRQSVATADEQRRGERERLIAVLENQHHAGSQQVEAAHRIAGHVKALGDKLDRTQTEVVDRAKDETERARARNRLAEAVSAAGRSAPGSDPSGISPAASDAVRWLLPEEEHAELHEALVCGDPAKLSRAIEEALGSAVAEWQAARAWQDGQPAAVAAELNDAGHETLRSIFHPEPAERT